MLTHGNEASGPFAKTVRSFGNSLGGFNAFLNELAYKPKGKQSYLFYLPWLNHDFNATFNLQDAAGPALRGLVSISCTGSTLAYGVIENPLSYEPFLQTLAQITGIPRPEEIPVAPAHAENGHCKYAPKGSG